MARRKTHPDYVRVKTTLSQRLKQVRTKFYGERGGPEMARRLNLPVRTWYNYESGVTVPAEVVLKFVELTGVDPIWLLRGDGEPSQMPSAEPIGPRLEPLATDFTVSDLLREALHRLETNGTNGHATKVEPPLSRGRFPAGDGADLASSVVARADASPDGTRPRYIVAQRDWIDQDVPFRCLLVEGDTMTPVVSDGAFVAYAEQAEPVEALDGQLVVVKLPDQPRPLVRWLQISGNFAILRAENREADVAPVLFEIEKAAGSHPLRRVLWVSTPH